MKTFVLPLDSTQYPHLEIAKDNGFVDKEMNVAIGGTFSQRKKA